MIKINLVRFPQKPGVYFFRDQRGKIIYIGKAARIRNRLRSYFAESADLSPAKRSLLKDAWKITWQIAASDIEALILEARLIKKYRPRYNVLLRDDKNYFFVGFTKEKLPRVFLTHQTAQQSAMYLGPFTEGRPIKTTLRLLRRIFPYATHDGFPKRCLEYELGLCPIPPDVADPDAVFIRQYQHNIRALKDVLSGKRQALLKRLTQEMKAAAKGEDFKTAARRRDEVRGLKRVFDHSHVLNGEKIHYIERADIPIEVRRLLGRKPLKRIEGYDIANLAHGRAAAGSMVVFTNGRPDRNEYRQFRIKTVPGANDVAMLQEVLRRRLRNDWPLPELIMVDGGRAQLNAALAIMNHELRIKNKGIVVIALAKQSEEIYVPGLVEPLHLPKDYPFLQFLMHLRDEAHRFARRYHFRLRGPLTDCR